MRKNKMIGIVLSALALVALLQYGMQMFQQGSMANESTEIVDNRKQITNQQDDVYQSSVLINSIEKESEYGTGYVVGKNEVATNRHVVQEVKDNPEKAVVKVGHKDENGNVTFEEFKIKEFILPEDETIDVALCKLEPGEDGKTISDYRKIVEFGDSSQVQIGTKLTVVGFPGDKEYGTMWAGTGEVNMLEGTMISFSAITAPGNSGSPLFNEEGKVVAMNNAGGDNSSFGFLIDDTILSFFQSHIE